MSNQSAAEAVVRLNDDDYYGLSEAETLALQQRLLDSLEESDDDDDDDDGDWTPPELPPVLAVGVPRRVHVDRREDVPLLLATHTSGFREWQVEERQNLHVLVVDLDRRVSWSAKLLTSHKRERIPPKSGAGKRPDRVNAESTSTGVQVHTGMRERLMLPWRRGRFALVVIYYDWASNVCDLELVPPPPPEGTEPPGPPLPKGGRPSAHVTEADVTLAEGDGAVLEAVPEYEPEADIHLRLGARVSREGAPLLWQRVYPNPEKPPEEPVLVGTLWLVRLDDEPQRVEVRLPGRLVGEGAEQRVEASGQLDLRKAAAAGGVDLSGAHQLYVTFGSALAGPRRLQKKPQPFNAE